MQKIHDTIGTNVVFSHCIMLVVIPPIILVKWIWKVFLH